MFFDGEHKEAHRGVSLCLQILPLDIWNLGIKQFQIAWYSLLSNPLYSDSGTEYVSKARLYNLGRKNNMSYGKVPRDSLVCSQV